MMSPSSNSSCSRWCPTAQQVMILEELYRRGVRAPNDFQRQTIAAHLSLYGRIHPKSVFYWFQNHKARFLRRLKLRNINPNKNNILHHFHMTSGIFHAQETMKKEAEAVHDLMMICNCKTRPLVTLQLFPLTSSK